MGVEYEVVYESAADNLGGLVSKLNRFAAEGYRIESSTLVDAVTGSVPTPTGMMSTHSVMAMVLLSRDAADDASGA